MPRNLFSQTYQVYILPDKGNNDGLNIGIITRIDPIDIWRDGMKPTKGKGTGYIGPGAKGKVTEPKKRRLSDTPDAKKPAEDKPEPKPDAKAAETPPEAKTGADTKTKPEAKGVPSTNPKPKHVAASFNLHLDRPVAIIATQFMDRTEKNEKERITQAEELAKFAT
eukprot:204964_1